MKEKLKPCSCGYSPKEETEILGIYLSFGKPNNGYFAKCPKCGKGTNVFFKNTGIYPPQTKQEIIELALKEWNEINEFN